MQVESAKRLRTERIRINRPPAETRGCGRGDIRINAIVLHRVGKS